MQEKKLTEYDKMLSGNLFNPGDKSFLFALLKSEWLQRRLNRTPLWLQKRRERTFCKLVGSIDGNPYNIFSPFRCVFGKNIYVGKNFFANWNLCIQDYAEVHIGDNVFVGPNVSIVTVLHPINPAERSPKVVQSSLISGSRGNYERALPVNIGNNVLIYTNSTICPGVTIGDNAVIGAGSVVTKDVPPHTFACGVPAKVIREITEKDRLEINI